MRISEKEELILQYSSNLKNNNFNKIAWDWADLAQGLGLDFLLGGAVGAGIAAYQGAPLLGGALTGMGLTLNPVGLILLSAGVVATVWSVTRQTDDNIEDLIDRLEDLDPNKNAEGMIKNWIDTLTEYQEFFKLQPSAQDPKQKAEQIGKKIENLDRVLNYLKQMRADWPDVKNNLTDIGVDASQAETALNKTLRSTANGLAAIRQTSQKEGAKLVEDLGKQSGVNYKEIAKKVIEFHNKIIAVDGNPPEYEEYEKPAFQLAQNILANKAELQDINLLGPQMKGLARDLEKLLQVASRKKRKADVKQHISKRAVKLKGDPGTPSAERRAPNVKDQGTLSLQKAINYLNLNLKTGIGRVAEDGVYGDATAKALYDFFQKIPVAEEHLIRRVGIDKQNVLDVNFMKSNPDYFAGLVNVVVMFVNQIYPTSKQENKKQQPSEYDAGVVQCREDKENPKPAEILACLKARQVRDPQTEQVFTAYEFLKQKGMRDNDIVALITQLEGGAKSEDWSMPRLVKYVSGPRFSVFRGY